MCICYPLKTLLDETRQAEPLAVTSSRAVTDSCGAQVFFILIVFSFYIIVSVISFKNLSVYRVMHYRELYFMHIRTLVIVAATDQGASSQHRVVHWPEQRSLNPEIQSDLGKHAWAVFVRPLALVSNLCAH